MESAPPELALAGRLRELEQSGFALLTDCYGPMETGTLRANAEASFLRHRADESVRSSEGEVYAARNVLSFWPEAAQAWRTPALVNFVERVLGEAAGLVRILYFDKPPEQTWSLPWHKDLLIAVRPPRSLSPLYSTPRPRAGVLHTEPPLPVLEGMLTLRIHLDDATQENGPLQVMATSHLTGKSFEPSPTARIVTILAAAGDVLAMRPLLMHASGRSIPGTTRHRRILHLEFANHPDLPDGYEWEWFFPVLPGSANVSR